MDEIEISSLVDKVDRKQMVLPEMQRRYVWRSTQVRDLFDSLYRGYPVGSILVWERPDADVEGRNLDVGENAGATRTGVTELLLDGQQRDFWGNAQPRDWRENAQPRDWGGLEQLNLRDET